MIIFENVCKVNDNTNKKSLYAHLITHPSSETMPCKLVMRSISWKEQAARGNRMDTNYLLQPDGCKLSVATGWIQTICCNRMDTNYLLQPDGCKLSVATGWIQTICCNRMNANYLLQPDGYKLSVATGWIQTICCNRMDANYLLQPDGYKLSV